jgi:ribosome recycling factor
MGRSSLRKLPDTGYINPNRLLLRRNLKPPITFFSSFLLFLSKICEPMSELIKKQVNDAKALMDKAIDHCEGELQKIRAGKASPAMLDDIMVEYYGSPTPLNQVASVNTPDARTIVIQPWEKSMLNPIEKAIMEANLGVNPQNDGVIIRINVPPLTEERRRDLVKKAKAEAETGKIAIRNIRKDANEKIRKLKTEGVSEDEMKVGEHEIQKLTDAYIIKVDQHSDAKEKDIMTV